MDCVIKMMTRFGERNKLFHFLLWFVVCGIMQVFSLSITEIGHLISLGPRESCEFFHDPFKGKGYV